MSRYPYMKPGKNDPWWAGLVSNFSKSFIYDPDYANFPEWQRLKASRLALNASFKRSRFWFALIFLIAAIVGFSMIDMWLHVTDNNGTGGAILGFIVGMIALQRAIYYGGLAKYRAQMEKHKIAEQGVAPNLTLPPSNQSTSSVRGPED